MSEAKIFCFLNLFFLHFSNGENLKSGEEGGKYSSYGWGIYFSKKHMHCELLPRGYNAYCTKTMINWLNLAFTIYLKGEGGGVVGLWSLEARSRTFFYAVWSLQACLLCKRCGCNQEDHLERHRCRVCFFGCDREITWRGGLELCDGWLLGIT